MIENPSLKRSGSIRKVVRKRFLAGVTLSRCSLPLILAVQAVVSWALLRNTAFQDEALYIYAGQQIWNHWLVGRPLLDNYSYYFSGYPYIYPIIGGLLDLLGGLELARLFSLVCMMIVTACGYYITKQFFDQKSAVFAAIFFVCQGPVLFLSRLATYDPLCLCLLAIGATLAVNASQAQRPWRSLSIGPLLVLAFLAKYAALLFIPSILATLALCTLLRWGWKSMVVRGMLGMLSVMAAGTLAAIVILHLDPSMLHAISATTLSRVVAVEYSRLALVEEVVTMVGISYVLGLVGLVFAQRKYRLIGLLLLGSALFVPAYHIYKAELISLDKHLGFSMFFVMPIAGYALASLSGLRRTHSSGHYWFAGVAVCLMLFLIGTGEARNLYSQWPDTTSLVYAVETQIRPASGHYLAEQSEVLRYYTENDTYTWQWIDPYFFQYTDKQGHFYQGTEAYIKAIDDGYFDLIELDFGATVQFDHTISRAIAQSQKYDLIDKIPQWDSYGASYFFLWRKR